MTNLLSPPFFLFLLSLAAVFRASYASISGVPSGGSSAKGGAGNVFVPPELDVQLDTITMQEEEKKKRIKEGGIGDPSDDSDGDAAADDDDDDDEDGSGEVFNGGDDDDDDDDDDNKNSDNGDNNDSNGDGDGDSDDNDENGDITDKNSGGNEHESRTKVVADSSSPTPSSASIGSRLSSVLLRRPKASPFDSRQVSASYQAVGEDAAEGPSPMTTAETFTLPDDDVEELNRSRRALLHNEIVKHIYPSESASLLSLSQQGRRDPSNPNRISIGTFYKELRTEFEHQMLTKSPTPPPRAWLTRDTHKTLRRRAALGVERGWRARVNAGSGSSEVFNGVRFGGGTTATGSMQEIVALSLAHTYGFDFLVLSNSLLSELRKVLLASGLYEIDSPGMKTSELVRAVLQVVRGERRVGRGKLRDLLRESGDEVDSVAVAKEEAEELFPLNPTEAPTDTNSNTDSNPTLIFLPTGSASSILRSKTSIELLSSELSDPLTKNLVVIGHEQNPSTMISKLNPFTDDNSASANQQILKPTQPSPSEAMWDWMNNRAIPDRLPNIPPPEQLKAMLTPPSPLDKNNLSPQQKDKLQRMERETSAAGLTDPPGSTRFNIFIARSPFSRNVFYGAVASPLPAQWNGNPFSQQNMAKVFEQIKSYNNSTDDDVSSVSSQKYRNPFGGDGKLLDGIYVPPMGLDEDMLDSEKFPMVKEWVSSLIASICVDGKKLAGEGKEDYLVAVFGKMLENPRMATGVRESLEKAAPALIDARCMGIQLSIYVPPPLGHENAGRMPSHEFFPENMKKLRENMEYMRKVGVDIKINDSFHSKSRGSRQRITAPPPKIAREQRGLAKLRSLCTPVSLSHPSDPKKSRSWESFIKHECKLLCQKKNRKALSAYMDAYKLTIVNYDSEPILSQLLSVKDVSHEMSDIVQTAIEIEASRSRAKFIGKPVASATFSTIPSPTPPSPTIVNEVEGYTTIALSSLEASFAAVSNISASRNGIGSSSKSTGLDNHRTREEINRLATNKHETALTSQVVSAGDIGVTYDMIGGLEEVKELLRESVTYPLKYPHLYSEGIAREAVKGVLLFGPPGTGKTMLAKAVATEGGATFLSVDASSVENKWLGESEKNAKAVFTLARRLAPCVVFLDEVDSMLSSRESNDDSAHSTLTSVKTTMMSEWDGLNSGTNGEGVGGSDRVIVIGSTNRPFDLDEAVLRRFPRRILVDLPDARTREEILRVTMKFNRVSPEVNFTTVAESLEGYTGSDVKEVCREAVVRISNEQAKILERGGWGEVGGDCSDTTFSVLRDVTKEDFSNAIKKLKKSVSEDGISTQKVAKWNEEFGEIKKKGKRGYDLLSEVYL